MLRLFVLQELEGFFSGVLGAAAEFRVCSRGLAVSGCGLRFAAVSGVGLGPLWIEEGG